jgi:hypothetical protein
MAEPMQTETEELDVQVEIPESAVEQSVSEEKTDPVVIETVETLPTDQPKSDEEEQAEYSESVKKRINKLTYKIREAERREAAALEYAQNVQKKLNTTEQSLSQKDKNLYDEYSARVESQLASAEERYKKAHDLGDSDKMLAAHKDVSTLAVELESLNRVKPATNTQAKVANQEPVVAHPAPTQVPPQEVGAAQQQPAPDPKAQDWAKNNTWFGNDLAMTTSAFAFHRQLVEQEGFDPSSDDYYQEVDKRMSESFPHKLGKATTQIVQENVAGPSRGARGRASKGRTVKLTSSEVAIAKRLGVPLEEYAKHVKR